MFDWNNFETLLCGCLIERCSICMVYKGHLGDDAQGKVSAKVKPRDTDVIRVLSLLYHLN